MRKNGDVPTRGRYHHGDLRNALLEAALRLVAERGVEGFSLREAAREVGVSPAAAYRHFEDRAALLKAVALDGFTRLAAGMRRAMAGAPGEPGSAARAASELVAIGGAYIEFAVRHPSHFRVMFGPWCAPEDMPAPGDEALRTPFQILVDALDRLVSTGAVRAEARNGAEVVAWSGVHGLASLVVEGALPLSAAERRQAMAQLGRSLLVGLGVAPELAGPGGKLVLGDGNCARRG